MRRGKRKLLGCCRPISIVHAQQPLRPFRSGEGRKGRGIIGKSGGADTTAAENPGRGSLSKYSNKFLGEEEAGGPEGAIHIFPALLSISLPRRASYFLQESIFLSRSPWKREVGREKYLDAFVVARITELKYAGSNLELRIECTLTHVLFSLLVPGPSTLPPSRTTRRSAGGGGGSTRRRQQPSPSAPSPSSSSSSSPSSSSSSVATLTALANTSVNLPCDISLPNNHERVELIFWYREDLAKLVYR